MISQQSIKQLPDTPGVYYFLHGKKILYIGKATSLRDRVRSYFSNDVLQTRGPKIVRMLELADSIDFTETDSVLEALILESNEIKRVQPEYNTREKDNKSYNYVVITNEEFPRVFTVRERELLRNSATIIPSSAYARSYGATRKAGISSKKLPSLLDYKVKHVFGPFPHGGQLIEALKIIRRIFPFRDKKAKQEHAERFYRMIGLAPDTTTGEAKKSYKDTIANIKLFFEGKKKRLLQKLDKEMMMYAKQRKFEQAEMTKRQKFALEHIHDIALIKEDLKIDAKRTYRIEAYDVAHLSGTHTVGVMTVVTDAEIDKSEYKKFKIRSEKKGSDTHALHEILERRFNHPEWRFPNVIVVDGSIAQKRVAESVMRDYGMAIPVVAVTKDERHRPRDLKGRKEIIEEHQKSIILANAEAHRFAVKYHREKRGKLA